MAPRKRLLDRLNPDSGGQIRLDLARSLPAALSPTTRSWLRRVVAAAESRNVPLYLVGGFVRDLLLGKPTLDLDLVVEGDAIAFGHALVRRLGGKLLPHKSFGTAVWTLPAKAGLPDFVDLISARRESYANPGALPTVQFAAIYDDQYRRDFSINTLALRLDGPNAGQVLDAWHGVEDLRRGRLRVLHSESFSDDPTRILRLLRFAGRLGFKIEPATLSQMKANVPLLDLVSGERIAKELELALLEPKRNAVLGLLSRYGVLRAIQPGLQFNSGITSALARSKMPAKFWDLATNPAELGFVLWLSQLSPAAAAAVAQRLRFPASLAAAAVGAQSLRASVAKLATLAPSALTARLDREPLLAVYALYLLQAGTKLGARLLRYAKSWRTLRAFVGGNDLLRLGIKPGPAYSRILSQLRAAQLDGKLKTKRQAQARLRAILDEQH